MDHIEAAFVTGPIPQCEVDPTETYHSLHEDDGFGAASEVLLSQGQGVIQLFLHSAENNDPQSLSHLQAVTSTDAQPNTEAVSPGNNVPIDPNGFSILPFTLTKDSHLVQLTEDGKINLIPKACLSQVSTPLQFMESCSTSESLTESSTANDNENHEADKSDVTSISYIMTNPEEVSLEKDTEQVHATDGAQFNGDSHSSVMQISPNLSVKADEEPQQITVHSCVFVGCKKYFRTEKQLKAHRRQHMMDKPYVCGFEDCKKSFASRCTLLNHTRVHTGEKPYVCTYEPCAKAFKTSGDLQKHSRIHTGERPFECPFEGCKKSFTTSNIRKVHMRVHTGERPYKCEKSDCGKTFASATNFRNHQRIHTGERPYVCMINNCGKRFTEYSSLYKHHVVHTQEKPYTCEQCSKTYRQASTLATHKRLAHNELGDETSDPSLDTAGLVQCEETVAEQSQTDLTSQQLTSSPPRPELAGNKKPKSTTVEETAQPSSALQFLPSQKEFVCNMPGEQIVAATFPLYSLTSADRVYLISDPENIQLFSQLTSSSTNQPLAANSEQSVSDQFLNPPGFIKPDPSNKAE